MHSSVTLALGGRAHRERLNLNPLSPLADRSSDNCVAAAHRFKRENHAHIYHRIRGERRLHSAAL